MLMLHQSPSSLEFLFMFAIGLLDGNEPLPKQAAADFWVSRAASWPAQANRRQSE